MRLILLFFVFWLGGCGYVGDPMPPALKVPLAVSDLVVTQRGGSLLVTFTIPDQTMEGLPLEALGGMELKIGADFVPFNSDTWSGAARISDANETKPGKVTAKIPAADWADKDVVIGVRLLSTRQRLSLWSNLVRLKVQPVLATPENLRAVASAEGVVLDWTSLAPLPGLEWVLFRQGATDKEPLELGKSREPRFLDTGAEFGVEYQYSAQAQREAARSEVSASVRITPVDSFPPAIPQGITALATASAIIVSWDRSTEPDFGMYRIFRATGDGPLMKIAESASAATYRDSDVRAGERYRYAVSASDKTGNESKQSQTVEIQQQ